MSKKLKKLIQGLPQISEVVQYVGWLVVLMSFCITTHAATIEQIRVSKDPTQTRVVLDSHQPIQAKLTSLQQPDRLMVDIADAKLKATIDVNTLFGTSIKNIRSNEGNQGHLRLVFDLAGPQKVHNFVLNPSPVPGQIVTKPQWYRLVIDLKDPVLDTTSSKLMFSPPTKDVKGNVQPNKVVLLVKKPQAVLEVKQQPIQDNVPVSRVIEQPTPAASTGVQQTATTVAPTAVTAATQNKAAIALSPTVKPKVMLSLASGQRRKVIVVLDAGHGGHDSGAVGPSGVFEKDVVLKITHALAELINQQPGMQAVLTRTDDYFIPLRERLRLARKGKADMFIAIHADAYKLPHSSGASVFALSSKGASSEAARWLAEKENYSELGGTTVKDKNPLLFSVLLDLSQTGTIRESLKLGEDILQELRKITRLHHNYVEQAPFMVLKSPDIPSLLIETGFISNPEEEQKLNDAAYHVQLSEAIVKGIRQYFVLNPPPNSFFAQAT